LLAHDRQRSAGHINDAIEICVHQRLESLSELNCSNGAMSPYPALFYDDIEVSETSTRHLHRCLRRLFVSHVERRRCEFDRHTYSPIFEAARVAGGCDEAVGQPPATASAMLRPNPLPLPVTNQDV